MFGTMPVRFHHCLTAHQHEDDRRIVSAAAKWGRITGWGCFDGLNSKVVVRTEYGGA
jgi:hypothetical protein